MKPLPRELAQGPFTREQAAALGVTHQMLKGRRFVRVFPRVWCASAHELTRDDWIAAARLTLGAGALLTGLTRIQALGLDFGPAHPLHFVVEGELHLATEGIVLHRTEQLAPHDGSSVHAAGAFISFCTRARVIDAIQVGDWLLHERHTDHDEIRALALAAPWRDGADEALWLLDLLDGRSRSLRESELRALIEASGLPRPEVNHPLEVAALGDLVILPWGLVVEYEGGHHQADRAQYSADIDRYALFRRHSIPYLQVTRERLRSPRSVVRSVYRELRLLGYDGPAPAFGDTWEGLFMPIRSLLGPRRERLRARVSGQR